MNQEAISEAVQDYVKAIYKLIEKEGEVTTSALAERLQVAPSSVTSMLKKIERMGLAVYTPYQGVKLTRQGITMALEIIRHHRILERYLTDVVGMTWDQVDEEAERLEHFISETFEEKMADALNGPDADPHGAPIPPRNAHAILPRRKYYRLENMKAGEVAMVRRVPDSDPELLRYLASLDLFPGVLIKLLEESVEFEPFRVLVGERKQILGRELARKLLLSQPAPLSEEIT